MSRGPAVAALAALLLASPALQGAGAAGRHVPNDPLYPASWSLRQLDAPAIWRVTRGEPAVTVAVLDTGVDASHPDLAGAVRPGIDLVDGGDHPADAHGHGTLVAGIVAARTDNRRGGVGICGRCSILPVRVIDEQGHGSGAVVARGIVWAVDRGARVVNLSLVFDADDPDVRAAVAYARGRNVLVVAAAGNTGSSAATFPAAYPGVLGVAATDERRQLFAWSNRGGWTAVSAPGCTPAPVPGGAYATFCGTSAAAALVSGLAALAFSHVPGARVDEVARTAVALASVPRRASPARLLAALARRDAARRAG